MDYTVERGSEKRSLGIGTRESGFQVDPGALSRRNECRHGCNREHEEETCVP